MFAVIVGEMSMETVEDQQRVYSLVDELKVKYNDLIVVTSGCERGIGKFVRARCIDGDRKARDVGFIEVAVFPWANRDNLPPARLAQAYLCKNAALLELGEEFHVFADANRRYGHVYDLIERVRRADHKPSLTLY